MKLHVCTDIGGPRREVSDALREAAGALAVGASIRDALNTLADAVDEAPRVPTGTLATRSVVEVAGAGLTIPADGRIPVEDFGTTAVAIAGGGRIVRLAVVAHIVSPKRGRR